MSDGSPAPPSKKARVIAELIRGPATRFELEQRARDHVPNSTIAELKRDGLAIDSEIVAVPGYGGRPAWIARYTLREESRELARELMRRGRRASAGAS